MSKLTKLALLFFGILIIGGIVVSSVSQKINLPISQPVVTNPRTPNASGTPSDLPVLAEQMPEFFGISKWWNTPDGQPLTPASLKGKVVLIDFWTYSCINCIRTFPYLKSLQAKYADKGLVIVGVHTPEFAFEAKPENVEREIQKNGFTYPVALDPDYGTWNAYHNQYWPAEYFFDRQGRLRHTHFGEGEYDANEQIIRDLLAETPGVDLGAAGNLGSTPDFSKIKTPETYFGLSRGDAYMGKLTSAEAVEPNKWGTDGTWAFGQEFAEADSAGAVFRFNVQASKLHIVMDSADGKDKTVEVYVDGMKTKELIINTSTLYTVAEFPDAGRHTVEIRMREQGVRFYAATFS